MSEKSYINDLGENVFTSHFLKARGTCCKTACLHCPYGFTTKKLGIQFQNFESANELKAKDILEQHGKTLDVLSNYTSENIKFVLIKEKIAGILTKNHIVIKDLYLDRYFKDQDLYKELIESYLF